MSAPVPDTIAVGALDLAALLCSRVCHDLISPVGAIVNGIEVLDEGRDEETKAFALDFLRKSAAQVSAKLQFCRMAFGAAGSAGAQIELGDAEKTARGLLEDGKTTLVWNLPRELMAKNRVKLLMNMIMMAATAIPRGGRLTADPIQGAEGVSGGFAVKASGLNARLPAATAELISGSPGQTVDAHAIQPFYAGILARDCGLALSVGSESEAVVFTAR